METSIAVREDTLPAPMTARDVVAQVQVIQQVMAACMKEGEHFGTIPGCGNKKVLLKSGAEKLAMTFRLAPSFDVKQTDLNQGHREYQVICTLHSIKTGANLGQGVGACSTMESKYRYRKANLACPKCGKETIIKGKAEFGGGWLCFGKKGGCGEKWTDDDNPFAGMSMDKAEHDNPADYYNTVLKMAKKRAQVDATLTVCAASDLFTQDLEEGHETEPEGQQEPPTGKKAPTPPKKEPTAGTGRQKITLPEDNHEIYHRFSESDPFVVLASECEGVEASTACGFGKNKGMQWHELDDQKQLPWYWAAAVKNINEGKYVPKAVADLMGINSALVSAGHDMHVVFEGRD